MINHWAALSRGVSFTPCVHICACKQLLTGPQPLFWPKKPSNQPTTKFCMGKTHHIFFIKCTNLDKSVLIIQMSWCDSKWEPFCKATQWHNCNTIPTKLTSPSACMAWFDSVPLSKSGSIHANKNQNATSQRVSGQMPVWCPGAESGVGALSYIYPPTLQTAIPQHKTLHGFIRDEHREQFLLFNIEHRVIFPRCTIPQCLNDWSMLLLRSP